MPDSPMNSDQKSAEQPKLVGLTKRQQIEKSGKTIFISVAIAGAVVSLSLVLAQFLVRQGIFNQKVISQKQETSKRLEANLTNAEGLKKNVDALLANTSLSNLRVRPDDSVLQVIPDSLPSSGDPVSFSNSLYNKILQRSGASITGVSVGTPGGDVAAIAAPTDATAASAISTPVALPFTISTTGSIQQITQTLSDMDKVIRPIIITKLGVKASTGGTLTVDITGETYYLPALKIELGKKLVKP